MRYRVPHVIPLAAGLLLMVGSVLLIWHFIFKEDPQAFYELTQKASSSCLGPSDSCQGSQYRRGIKRDVWYQKGEERYHARLTSRDSEFFFAHDSQNNALTETLSDVICMLQEGFSQGNQNVKIIRAKNAVYDYYKQELTADNVSMEEFEWPGTALPEIPYETGSKGRTFAGKATVSFKGTFQVKADKVRAERL